MTENATPMEAVVGFTLAVEKDPETGMFFGTSPDIHGLFVSGDSRDDVTDAAPWVAAALLRASVAPKAVAVCATTKELAAFRAARVAWQASGHADDAAYLEMVAALDRLDAMVAASDGDPA